LTDFNNFWHATFKKNLTQMSVVMATAHYCCCYTTLWTAEVVVLPLTTMNLYWVVHASAQKIT